MVVPIFICGHSGRSNLLTEDNAKHWRGAEPKRRQWRIKRGGSRVSKGVCQAEEKADDNCEPDRANKVKRDGVRLPYAPPQDEVSNSDALAAGSHSESV